MDCPFGTAPEQLRSAYYRLVKKFHPDTSEDPNAAQKFMEIQQAYKHLSDPKKKKEYDTNAKKINENTYLDENVTLIEFEQATQNVLNASDFYKAVDDLLSKIYEEEACWTMEAAPAKFPSFGDENSSFEEVEEFYRKCNSFQTVIPFLWLNIDTNYDDIQNRAERRYVVGENKKKRSEAMKARNKGFKDLIVTLRESDSRITKFKEEKQKHAEEKRQKQKQLEKEERLRLIREAETLQSKAENSELEEAMRQVQSFEFSKAKKEQGEHYVCEACNRRYLVTNRETHEKTKLHTSNVQLMKKKKKKGGKTC